MGKIIGLSGLISASGEKKKKGSYAGKASASASKSRSMGRKAGGYVKKGPGAKGIAGKGAKKALGRRPAGPGVGSGLAPKPGKKKP